MGGAAVTAGGRFLVVGATRLCNDPSSGFVLKVFRLPELRLVRTEAMSYAHFVDGPSGGLLAFTLGDWPGPSMGRSTAIRNVRVRPRLVQRQIVRVSGTVWDVAVPGDEA